MKRNVPSIKGLSIFTLCFLASVLSTASTAETSHNLEQQLAAFFEQVPATQYFIKPQELPELPDKPTQDYFLIDMRPPTDYTIGHIEGA